MDKSHIENTSPETRKSQELRLFLFLVIFLFPILAVAVVGSYGFAIWMSHILMGPPGPPPL